MQDNMAIQQSQPASLTVWETIHLFRGFTPLGCIRLCGVCWYRMRGEMLDQTLTQKCRKMENEKGPKWKGALCVCVCLYILYLAYGVSYVSSTRLLTPVCMPSSPSPVISTRKVSCQHSARVWLSNFCHYIYTWTVVQRDACMLGSLSASEIGKQVLK